MILKIIAILITFLLPNIYSKEINIQPLKESPSFESVKSKNPPFTIVYMPPAKEFNYYIDIGKGLKEVITPTDNKYYTFAPQSDNPNLQYKMLKEAIRRHVDAIIFSTHNPTLLSPLVKSAVQKGIIVVIVNSDTPSFQTPVHAIVGYKQREGTKKLGLFLSKRINKENKLKVGIITGAPGYHSTERVNGFKNGIKGSRLKIVSEVNGKWNTKGGHEATLKMFKEHPDIKAIFAANDYEIMGAQSALKQLNISNIILLGNDGDPAALEKIYTNNITATVFTDPVGMGKTTMKTVLGILNGKSKGGIIETPTSIAHKDNIEKYWNKPLQTRDKNFKSILAVSTNVYKLTEDHGLGLYWEILRKIYQPEGFTIKTKIVPAKRSHLMVQKNQADLFLGSLKGEVQGVLYPQWHYSANVISVIYKKKLFPDFKGQETLKNKKIGWIIGLNYDQYLHVPVEQDITRNIMGGFLKLNANRIDFLLGSVFEIENIIKNEVVKLHQNGFNPKEYSIKEILRLKEYIAFANTEKGIKLRNIFDDKIPSLITSGELKKLFEKWGFHPFPF